jgi:hypothetical protein
VADPLSGDAVAEAKYNAMHTAITAAIARFFVAIAVWTSEIEEGLVR